MAPTPQPTMTREQQQALAKARARARISTGAGLGPTNPMVAQGQAAQREYADAGSPALPKPQPAPAPRVDLRNVNRAPQTQGLGYAEAKGSEIVGSDLQKGLRTIPQRIGNAAIGAVESAVNLPADLINSSRQANAAYKPDTANALRNVNRMPQMQARVGSQRSDPSKVPMVPTVQAPRIPIADQDQSVSGQLLEGFAQFLLARGAIGKAAKGGGIASQLGKDIATTGVAFQGNTGRVSDMIDPNSMPAGPMRDYAAWLKTQPEDSPIMGRLKNMLEDATLSGPMVAPHVAVRGAQAVGNSLKPSSVSPPPAAVSPSPTAAAPTPAATQSAPVAQPAIPQASPGAAQAGPASAGQGAAGAVPPAGAPPVLNATPVNVPAGQSPRAVARSDAKNLYGLMKAAGVPRDDIKPLLADMVNAFNGVNDPRMRLKFFAAEYLPQKLPKPVADAVLKQFDAFGYQQLTAPGPGAGVMTNSIDEIRNTQKAYLEGEFDAAFGKQDLITTKGKVRKLKSDNADAIYKSQIDRQQRNITNNAASNEQMAARDDLLLKMGEPEFFEKIPLELKLASKNEGYGSLWEYVHQKPLESAHWLQSKLGFLARKGGESAGAYEQMRKMLLAPLEEAVPGYRGARMQHGDAVGQDLAIKLGPELRAAANDRLKVAEIAERVKELPKSQQKVGQLSVKEMLTNEFRKTKGASRVDPVTGTPIDEQMAVITQLQKDGLLDALETVFPGSTKGPRASAAIRKIMRENEALPTYRSDTDPNSARRQGAVEAVRSPVNKLMRGVSDKTGYSFTIPADIAAGAMGVPPVFTASKVAGDLGSWLSKPNPKKMASTADLLYGARPARANALAIPPPRAKPRISGPKTTKLPATPENLQSLLDQYDKVDPGASPGEAERIRKEILRIQNALNAPAKIAGPAKGKTAKVSGPKANALSSPPSPPDKAGFGFGGSKQLPMDEASRMGRAREQGFDVDMPLYHGTSNEIASFIVGDRPGMLGYGVYVTDSPRVATEFSESAMLSGGDKARVVPVYAKGRFADSWKSTPTKNLPKNVQSSYFRSYYPDSVPYRELAHTKDGVEWLKSQGITGLVEADQRVVFDPKNIRRTDATFDPAEAGSSKLLAGMGGSEGASAFGGAAIGAGVAPDTNNDGVVDAQERAAGAFGGALTGIVGAKAVRAVGNSVASAARGSRFATDLPIEPKSFVARDGTEYTVNFTDSPIGTDVSFNPNSGPRATRNALKDEFKPQRNSSLGEANEVFSNVERLIAEDIAEAGRNRYVLSGRTPRQRDLYVQMASRKTPPPGYRWEVSDEGVALQRLSPRRPSQSAFGETDTAGGPPKTSAVPARNGVPEIRKTLDMTPDGYERTTQIGNAKLTYAVQNDGTLSLEMIDVPQSARSKGEAGAALDKLLAEADAKGLTVALDPSPTGTGGLSKTQLEAFYKSRGFTRQYGGGSHMMRSPASTGPDQASIFGGGRKPPTEPPPPVASTTDNVLPLKKGVADAPNDDITHIAHWDYTNPAGQRSSVQADFYDRKNGVLAIDVIWPSNVGDDLTDALVRRKNELNSKTKGFKVVDENFGKQTEASPDWAKTNLTEAQTIVKTVADRIVGLSNGKTPAVIVHTLDGYDNEMLLELLKRGRKGNQTVIRTKDGGSSLGIVDSEWLAQNPKVMSRETWEVAGQPREAGRWGSYIAPHPTSLAPGKYKAKGYEGGPWHVYDEAGNRVSSPDRAFLDKKEAQEWVSKVTSKTPPSQAGISFGGGKGPPAEANALKGPPKKPPPVLSRAAEEATRELKAARSAYNRASQKWVMRDDRELRVKPLEERVVAAEAKLAQVLKNDARLKTVAARGRAVIDSPNFSVPLKYGVGGTAILGGGLITANALLPKEKHERPMSPRDPIFYWHSVSKRKDAVIQAQSALDEWGEWPSDAEFTGTPGNITKAALETWRYNMRQLQLDKKVLGRELDLDAPISQDEMGMLLAGPGGYREGKAWKTKQGDSVSVPAP